ncbi:heavy-metal-associated domain-containing protein [Olleya sp. R77988]|uniref:heavy-metal-associated domain-containing protein n=1 Tax=Olleya sp. R77988 TaxID=3093875 RepID=UPI0037C6A5FA
MKSIKHILVLALVTVFAFSCKNEATPEVKTSPSSDNTEATTKSKINPDAKLAKAEFKIEGMTCAMGCAKTIEKKMAKMEGVKSAKVDFDKQLAMVEYDEAIVTPASLEKTVTSVADTYKVKDMHTVDAFSGAKKTCDANKKECDAKSKCKPDCTKKDCKDCAAKKAECKKTCDANKKECDSKSKCKADCTKKDCKDCAAKKAECKKKCASKTEAEKKACAKDCKKACCTGVKKA